MWGKLIAHNIVSIQTIHMWNCYYTCNSESKQGWQHQCKKAAKTLLPRKQSCVELKSYEL